MSKNIKHIELDVVEKEINNYRKYLKYTRTGQINIGNYNWLIVDPTLMKYSDIVAKIQQYSQNDNLYINVIRDVDYITRRTGFNETKYISDIQRIYTPLSFNEKTTCKLVVNVLVISTFLSNIAFSKFSKYCTFYLDLSPKNNIPEINNARILDIIHKNHFEITNLAILDELNDMPMYESETILTKAFIQTLNNHSTVIDNYLDISNDITKYLNELNSLIGLKNAKKVIKEIINYLTIAKKRNDIPCLNMAFLGNPGTGKTTVAKLVGNILSKLRILGHNAPFIQTSREKLVGRYIGDTEENTLKTINEAIGGVLFIDEAYSLTRSDSDRDFGRVALDVLVNQLDIHKHDLCVIFAGYKKEMLNFLQINPGLKSRIPFQIEFDDYNEYELLDIFLKLVNDSNFDFDIEISKFLIPHFQFAKKHQNFGNGRYIRNLVERIKIKQANRVINNKSDINYITVDDVNNAIESIQEIKQNEKRIGF